VPRGLTLPKLPAIDRQQHDYSRRSQQAQPIPKSLQGYLGALLLQIPSRQHQQDQPESVVSN